MRSLEGRIWAFDFDGTLSPLVPDRQGAAMDPGCEELLADLADDPSHVVAVISSRSLDDLRLRVHTEHVLLAGSSGLEWWVPGGHGLGPNQQATERLHTERRRLLPALRVLEQIHGVEIEDKTWSVAVHFREVTAADRGLVARALEAFHLRYGVSLHYGPDVAEVQLLQQVSKEIAVKTLVKRFGAGLTARSLVYAGDDENDAQAMRWVLQRKGIVYVVGGRISLAGALAVPDPTALALAIRHRFKPTRTESGRHEKGAIFG
jgi:trehalose 6-phosphate phosphatase